MGQGSPLNVIRRSYDAAEFNAIVNDPEVFRWLKVPGIDTFDLAPVISNPVNVLLMNEGGGIIFFQQEPGIYQVHTAFLKEFRGRYAIRASLEAYRWMFTHTDCMILQTTVPAFNKQARLCCPIVGFTYEFDRKNVWPTDDGLVDMSYWTMKYEDWIRRALDLENIGRAFHLELERQTSRLGSTEESHPDEDCHDLYVGACVETIYGGQPEKAVALYNRWARFSGYGLIALVAKEPLLINVGTALLKIENQTFRVIECLQQR